MMQFVHRRRLTVALVSSGIALTTLASIGLFGLLQGHADADETRPSASHTPDLLTPAARTERPQTVLATSDAELFARDVAEALFTWDTRYEGDLSDWAQAVVDVADPDEAAAVASDVRNYIPAVSMWDRLGTYGTRQWIKLDSVTVPDSWSTALEQAAPGQIPPGASAFTVIGTRHREGIWRSKVIRTERSVSFTVFVVCSRDTPCALLRLSQIDQSLD
jgi:hypothetical protein